MKVLLQIAASCLLLQLVVADHPSPYESVCDVLCKDEKPSEEFGSHTPYVGDCNAFCHCTLDGNFVNYCPPGLEFNPSTKICDWPEEAGCNFDKPICDYMCANSSSGDNLTFPGDCTKFCRCGAQNDEISCPEGLHFNPTLHECDIEENAGCDQ